MLDTLRKIKSLDLESEINIDLLQELVNQIRPPKNKINVAKQNINQLTKTLRIYNDEKEALRNYLTQLIRSRQCIQLFTDSGILTTKGFFRETMDRLNSRILPRAYNETDHTELFNLIFYKKWDYIWVSYIPDEDWSLLFQELGLKGVSFLQKEISMLSQLLNSILVLSQRVAAL